MKKCTCYPDSKTVVDFFAELGVPDGIIPGDKVIVTLSASEWGYPFGEDKKNFGTFIGVSKNLKGETLFMIAPSNGVMSYGDKIQRPPDRKKNDKLDYISNCPFHHCALNSGNGTCHSTNTKQCDSVPSQFLER